MKPKLITILAAALALALPCAAAYKKGDTAYTKRMETPLLAEPKPLAGHVAKINFAQALTIEEVRGSWLRVSSKTPKAAGWVYAGNVAADEPVVPPTGGMTAASASATQTAAAARPLTKIAQEYAQSRGHQTGFDEWLGGIAASVTDDDITRYLIETNRGEYKK